MKDKDFSCENEDLNGKENKCDNQCPACEWLDECN
jgi:hypothetical protein